jgi:lipid II:glycine glycyltransferase (peptidoglycan interpeptide bridge formation enzyme)
MLLAVEDALGVLRAGMPLMDLRGWLKGRRLVSLPFSDHTPMLLSSEADRDSLVDGLLDLLGQLGVDRCELHDSIPERTGVYGGAVALRHESALGDDPAAMFERFHRTRVRQPIEHAMSSGVTLERGDGLAALRDYYRLHVATRRRHGVPPQPWRFFQLLHERIFSAGLGHLFLARKDGHVIAGSIFLGWGSRLVYKFNASDPVYWKLSANQLLLWHAMQWGGANGFTTLDWGRTEPEHTGLRDFKRGFGTEEIPLHYSVITQQSPPADRSHQASQPVRGWGAQIIRHAPLWFCRGVGRVLYGQFG